MEAKKSVQEEYSVPIDEREEGAEGGPLKLHPSNLYPTTTTAGGGQQQQHNVSSELDISACTSVSAASSAFYQHPSQSYGGGGGGGGAVGHRGTTSGGGGGASASAQGYVFHTSTASSTASSSSLHAHHHHQALHRSLDADSVTFGTSVMASPGRIVGTDQQSQQEAPLPHHRAAFLSDVEMEHHRRLHHDDIEDEEADLIRPVIDDDDESVSAGDFVMMTSHKKKKEGGEDENDDPAAAPGGGFTVTTSVTTPRDRQQQSSILLGQQASGGGVAAGARTPPGMQTPTSRVVRPATFMHVNGRRVPVSLGESPMSTPSKRATTPGSPPPATQQQGGGGSTLGTPTSSTQKGSTLNYKAQPFEFCGGGGSGGRNRPQPHMGSRPSSSSVEPTNTLITTLSTAGNRVEAGVEEEAFRHDVETSVLDMLDDDDDVEGGEPYRQYPHAMCGPHHQQQPMMTMGSGSGYQHQPPPSSVNVRGVALRHAPSFAAGLPLVTGGTAGTTPAPAPAVIKKLPPEVLVTYQEKHSVVSVYNLEPKTTQKQLFNIFFPMGAADAVVFPITATDPLNTNPGAARRAGLVMFSSKDMALMAAEKLDDFVPHRQSQPLVCRYEPLLVTKKNVTDDDDAEQEKEGVEEEEERKGELEHAEAAQTEKEEVVVVEVGGNQTPRDTSTTTNTTAENTTTDLTQQQTYKPTTASRTPPTTTSITALPSSTHRSITSIIQAISDRHSATEIAASVINCLSDTQEDEHIVDECAGALVKCLQHFKSHVQTPLATALGHLADVKRRLERSGPWTVPPATTPLVRPSSSEKTGEVVGDDETQRKDDSKLSEMALQDIKAMVEKAQKQRFVLQQRVPPFFAAFARNIIRGIVQGRGVGETTTTIERSARVACGVVCGYLFEFGIINGNPFAMGKKILSEIPSKLHNAIGMVSGGAAGKQQLEEGVLEEADSLADAIVAMTTSWNTRHTNRKFRLRELKAKRNLELGGAAAMEENESDDENDKDDDEEEKKFKVTMQAIESARNELTMYRMERMSAAPATALSLAGSSSAGGSNSLRPSAASFTLPPASSSASLSGGGRPRSESGGGGLESGCRTPPLRGIPAGRTLTPGGGPSSAVVTRDADGEVTASARRLPSQHSTPDKRTTTTTMNMATIGASGISSSTNSTLPDLSLYTAASSNGGTATATCSGPPLGAPTSATFPQPQFGGSSTIAAAAATSYVGPPTREVTLQKDLLACTVYLTKIPMNVPEVNDFTLRDLFSQFGEVHKVRIYEDKHDRRGAFAFVEFAGSNSARAMIEYFRSPVSAVSTSFGGTFLGMRASYARSAIHDQDGRDALFDVNHHKMRGCLFGIRGPDGQTAALHAAAGAPSLLGGNPANVPPPSALFGASRTASSAATTAGMRHNPLHHRGNPHHSAAVAAPTSFMDPTILVNTMPHHLQQQPHQESTTETAAIKKHPHDTASHPSNKSGGGAVNATTSNLSEELKSLLGAPEP